jgi:Zn finger protein HypA/HybF involved in hydrogenase expression
MKPVNSEKLGKLCKRCFKNTATDIICPACKSDLLSIYDNKLSWRTAFEVERISKKAMRFSGDNDEDIY